MGIDILLKAGIKAVIISLEENPVVSARAQKLGLPHFYGIRDKARLLNNYLEQEQIASSEVVYVGNDINDLPCFPLVACAVAVADAQPEVLRQADQVLSRKGGFGAVREVCDILLSRLEENRKEKE